MWRDALRVGEGGGDVDGDTNLVDSNVWVGRDDSSSAEIDSLSAQVATEAALLSLEPLNEASQRLASRLVYRRQSWQIAVDVHCTLHLQEVPVLHQVDDWQALLNPLPQDVVHLDDLHQLHADVVLITARAAVHLYAGTYADRWHRHMRHDECLRTAADAQHLLILRADLLKKGHHPDWVEVVRYFLLRQVRCNLIVIAQRVLKLLLV
mmetsp:Transcript_10741/g.19426  ORF Transcript_10741/g.19426 Transcript_10741/m.19426 type:complete len:208 (-) Transcript_10741:583-1206(-)